MTPGQVKLLLVIAAAAANLGRRGRGRSSAFGDGLASPRVRPRNFSSDPRKTSPGEVSILATFLPIPEKRPRVR